MTYQSLWYFIPASILRWRVVCEGVIFSLHKNQYNNNIIILTNANMYSCSPQMNSSECLAVLQDVLEPVSHHTEYNVNWSMMYKLRMSLTTTLPKIFNAYMYKFCQFCSKTNFANTFSRFQQHNYCIKYELKISWEISFAAMLQPMKSMKIFNLRNVRLWYLKGSLPQQISSLVHLI